MLKSELPLPFLFVILQILASLTVARDGLRSSWWVMQRSSMNWMLENRFRVLAKARCYESVLRRARTLGYTWVPGT